MAEFEFPCSHCGQTLVIDVEGVGMEVQCPGCQAQLIVPEPPPAESPKRLGLKKDAAPAPAYTPGPPVREQSRPKKAAGKNVMSGALTWAWRAALVAIFIGIGYVVYSWVSRTQSTTRAHDMITELGAQSIQDWDRKNLAGFMGSAAETAKRIAPLLPKTPDLFKQECFTLSKIVDAYYRTAKLDSLTGIISQLPPGADLTPLLAIPPSSEQIYKCALQKLAAAAPGPWLIKKSCDKEEHVRKIAAEALKLWLPIELPPQEASLASRLADRTPVAEKQKLFDQLCSAVAAIVEKRIAGRYQIRVEATYRDDKTGEKPISLATKEPCLTVERRNLEWTFSFFGETWTGHLKELSRANFNLAIPTETFNHPYLANKNATLTLRVPEVALVLEIGPITNYAPPRVSEWGYQIPSQPGFTKFEYTLVRMEEAGK